MKGKDMLKSRGRLANGDPNPIDVYIGERIKLRRKMLKISQMELAQMLGITFQQVQKYERGNNRISGSRLWDISQVLEVSVNFFFEGINPDIQKKSPRSLLLGETKKLKKLPVDPMYSEEAVKLLNTYFKIKNKKLRESIFGLLVEMR